MVNWTEIKAVSLFTVAQGIQLKKMYLKDKLADVCRAFKIALHFGKWQRPCSSHSLSDFCEAEYNLYLVTSLVAIYFFYRVVNKIDTILAEQDQTLFMILQNNYCIWYIIQR